MARPNLEQYLQPEHKTSDFMREVARIAISRDIKSQEGVAKRYNAASGAGITGRNVREHFSSRRPQARVVANYAKALDMDPWYVHLLVRGEEADLSIGLRVAIDPFDSHRIETIATFFEYEAFYKAVALIRSRFSLERECVYRAELAVERHKAMPESNLVRRPSPAMLASGVPEETFIWWNAVAKVLKEETGLDLTSLRKPKSPWRIDKESLLVRVFRELHSSLNYPEYDDDGEISGEADLQLPEWLAVEQVLQMIALPRDLPVQNMLENLRNLSEYQVMLHAACEAAYPGRLFTNSLDTRGISLMDQEDD